MAMTEHSLHVPSSGASTVCPVCEGNARVVTTAQPGYQRPSHFSIVHCSACGTAHALPLESSSMLYELIYERADELPGYDRYARYARSVANAKDPLRYLASQEDVYWSIARYLDERGDVSGPVLEVGCGFGYLTYSLRKRGLAVTGIDLSVNAIERAKARYGPYFEARDVADLANNVPHSFSLVVMTEVIEHLPDFYSVMRAIANLLTDGGEAVVTTPNRSVYAAGTIWETDPPPVHLWWFTEDSMRAIARRLDLKVRFIDFAPLNARRPPSIPARKDDGRPTRRSMLGEDGLILVKSGFIRKFIPVGLIYDVLAKSRARVSGMRRKIMRSADPLHGRRQTLCAVFSRT